MRSNQQTSMIINLSLKTKTAKLPSAATISMGLMAPALKSARICSSSMVVLQRLNGLIPTIRNCLCLLIKMVGISLIPIASMYGPEAKKWCWGCPTLMEVFLWLYSCLLLEIDLSNSLTTNKRWRTTWWKISQMCSIWSQTQSNKYSPIRWEFLELSTALPGPSKIDACC